MGSKSNEMDEVMNSNQLVNRFIEAILEREAHEGNPIKANKLFKEIHSIFKELRKLGALDKLEPLLEHENVAVVNFASKYYLLVDEAKALERLERLAQLDGIDGFAAENLISRWKKGELNFDY